MAEQVNVDELLHQIITDRRYISATDNTGETVDLLVRSLTPAEKVRSQFIYKKAMAQARARGLPTYKECLADAISKGLWTRDKDKLISIYNAEIDKLEIQRDLYKHNKGKQIKYRNDITVVRKKLNKLVNEKALLTAYSAESSADTYRANYTISRLVLTVNDKQYWETYEDFLQERDSSFIKSLVEAYNRLPIISEAELRAIARSTSWSVMWSTSKNSSEPLFGKPTAEYTSEQAMLCYWAMMYDSVYESMDKPSDKVIEDDKALDAWFKEQRDKRDKESKRKSATKKSATDRHPEIFIMVDNDEDAEDVWQLNDEWTLARLRKEAQRIEESKEEYISEYKLRQNYIKKQLILNNSGKFAAARKDIAKRPTFLG